MKDLTQGNIYKNFFFFSIPIVLSSLLSSAFGVINTAVAGQFLGAEGLAATSIASPYTNLIVLIGNGYAYGFAILSGNLFGAKNYERLRRTLYSNLLAALIGFVVICGLSVVFLNPLFRFLQVEEQIFAASKQYFCLYCINLIFWQMSSMLMFCSHSMGDTKFPLLVSFVTAGVTALGNILTVAVFDFGVVGIGISSILAHVLSTSWYVLHFRKAFRQLGLSKGRVRPAFDDIKALASYSLPNMVQQIAMGGAGLAIAPVRNGLGYLVVAAFSVADRLRGYLQTFYYSASKTASNYIAQCVGAQQYQKVKKAVYVSLLQGFVFFGVLFVPIYLFADATCGLFVNRATDPEVFDYLHLYIRVYLPFISLHVFCGIFHSILRAVKSNTHLIGTTLGGALVTLFATLWLAPLYGIHGVFAAVAIGWGFECLYVLVLWFTGLWLPKGLRQKVLGHRQSAATVLTDL